MDGAETLFRKAWAERTNEDIARGFEMQKAAMKAARAVQESPVTPTIRPDGHGGWEMVEPDGTVSGRYASEEVAFNQLQARLAWEASGHREAVLRLVEWFRQRKPGVEVVIEERAKTVAEGMAESELNAETLVERMRIAAIQAGADPNKIYITGETVQELREGVYRDVIKIYYGADVRTVVEEFFHAQTNKELREGTITRQDLEEAARVWAAETGTRIGDPQKLTDTEIAGAGG